MRNFINSIFLWIILVSFSIVSTSFGEAKELPIVYESKGRRDPFIPLLRDKEQAGVSGLSGVESIEDIVLEGVVIDRKQGSFVVANGVLLAEGETQDGVKVVEIREEGASFEIKGRKQFKPFSPPDSSDSKGQ